MISNSSLNSHVFWTPKKHVKCILIVYCVVSSVWNCVLQISTVRKIQIFIHHHHQFPNSFSPVCFVYRADFNHLDQAVQFKYRLYKENWTVCLINDPLIVKFVCGPPTKGKCRLPYTVLDIKGCLQFISFKKSFAQIYFTLKLILL